MARPLRVGLTGGIASGKTTVANFFAELGAPIIDTDIIARQVVEPGAPALDEIRRAFGDAVFNDDGTLDRKVMRKLVFADSGKRRRLERILHPRIREVTLNQITAVTYPYMIIVVPLLAESPLKEYVDRVLVVDCSEDAQLARLLSRDADGEDQARRIIAAQASREERLAIADDVVRNDGHLDETRARVAELHDEYLAINKTGHE